jgi:hypothetical protein
MSIKNHKIGALIYDDEQDRIDIRFGIKTPSLPGLLDSHFRYIALSKNCY